MEIKLVNDGSQSSITQYSHYGIPESYLKTTPGALYTYGGYIRSGGLSAASEQWFEWDSARTGEDPEARPALPWPSYFTPAAKFSAAPSGWIYANRVFTMPLGFPNVQLRHRFTVQQPASGSVYLDNVFFVELPATNDARWIDVMPFGQTWRYSVTTPPINWMNRSFSDTGWPQGIAKFGAGTGPQNIRTPIAANKPAYYFRRTFAMDATNFATLLLAATCTDDYGGTVYPLRVWVNGNEIVSSGIEAVTGEGNEVKYFDLTPFAGMLRSNETNVIAVMLQNTWQPDWDNVAFDVSLKGVRATANVPGFTSIKYGANGAVALNLAGPPNSSWLLESLDSSIPNWALVQTIAFDVTGQATVVDNGQNGRPAPSATLSRFYRLRSP